MGKQASEILTIQKLIFLLTDFHYVELTAHFKRMKAALPLKMVNAIRRKLPDFHSPDELCRVVYGNSEDASKKKFNQLSSHTLRLSEHLAVNYQCYLHTRINDIQVLVNEGKWEQSVFLAEVLLNIAEKIEDYKCQLLCCKFLAERSFSIRDYTTGFKYDKRAQEALQLEDTVTQLLSKIRGALFSEKRLTQQGLQELKEEFKTFFVHEKCNLRILGMFYYLRLLFYYELRQFDSGEALPVIEMLSKELHNYPYVILPFMTDVKGMLIYMQLNSGLYSIEAKERKKLFSDLKEHYKHKKVQSGNLSTGELNLMAIESTQFLSKYHHLVGLKDYGERISVEDRRDLNALLAKLRGYLSLPVHSALPDFQVRSLRMLFGAMLIISGGKDVKAGLFELESMLVAYQQVNLGPSTDSIFLSLMVGYFALKDYDTCATTFKRFTKVKAGKIVYAGNDLKIHGYYYLSQYLFSGKKQYVEKMKELFANIEAENRPKSILELYSNCGVDI
jgi:hypothetical protein